MAHQPLPPPEGEGHGDARRNDDRNAQRHVNELPPSPPVLCAILRASHHAHDGADHGCRRQRSSNLSIAFAPTLLLADPPLAAIAQPRNGDGLVKVSGH